MLEERCGLKGDHGKPWTDQGTAIRPPASASSLADPSNAKRSKPSFWSAEFSIIGSRFVFSQLPAIRKSQMRVSSLDTPY